jgi:cytochrome c553
MLAWLQLAMYLFSQWQQVQWCQPCASCHGAEANGTATLPRLASQYASFYIETRLKQFNTRERNELTL